MEEVHNVLITGGAGFIGANVAVYLTRKYPLIKFVILDKLDYCSDKRNLDEVKSLPNFKFVKGDILQENHVLFVLQEEKIDTVMHFAANSSVDLSFGNTFKFVENNVLGTCKLLECCRVWGKIKKFIHVSTDEVYDYPEGEHHPPRSEDDKMLPTNPYAATKLGAEAMCHAFKKSFNLPIIITRSNNIYGPMQFPEKIIPKFISQLLKGKKMTLHGDGSNMRNYLHVKDVTRAFELILFNGEIGEIYNIGSQVEKTNLEVAREILSLYKYYHGWDRLNRVENESSHIEFVEDRNFNDKRYKIMSEKIKNLGWVEEVNWEDGIKETFEWYMLNTNRFKDVDRYLEAHPCK
jgi:UDP-glucose 4,6-dehydratase